MNIRILTSLLFLLTATTTHAAIRPIATLSAGADVVTTHMNQNIMIISPFHNNYFSNQRKEDVVGGLFLGVENNVSDNFLAQFGVGYYQNNAYQAEGTIYQFGDPNLGNLYYVYNIQSQRLLLESKLLGTVYNDYHPFINLGVGEAINSASQYTEIPITSADVAMSPVFSNKTIHSFTYLVGVGVDRDITNHIRLGGVYRYVNSGRAALSTTPTQESSDTLKNHPFYANELMLQLSYVG